MTNPTHGGFVARTTKRHSLKMNGHTNPMLVKMQVLTTKA